MSSLSDKLALVRSSIIVSDQPWTSGSIEVPNHFLKLFYTAKDKPDHSHTLLLNKEPSADKLIHLSSTCQPASFGSDGEDESYGKAGKLDISSFASPFDLHSTNILQTVITKLFKGPDANAPVIAKLQELNVYGPGSFSKAHKGTPRDTELIGSLVIIFPTLHKGGSLALRHTMEEFVRYSGMVRKERGFIFDSGSDSNLFDKEANTVAYVAFFSDVEHEVLPVTEGYRVTLTYNLYHAEPSKKTALPKPDIVTLMNALRSLIQDPTLLPRGGFLGFGLNHSYPIDVKSDSFWDMDLKGNDEVILVACIWLGLPVYIRGVCHDNYSEDPNPASIIMSAPFNPRNQELERNITYDLFEKGGQLIHPMGSDRPEVFRGYKCPKVFYKEPKEVAWITPLTNYTSFKTHYLEVGDDSEHVDSLYTKVCLMVAVGEAGKR